MLSVKYLVSKEKTHHGETISKFSKKQCNARKHSFGPFFFVLFDLITI